MPSCSRPKSRGCIIESSPPPSCLGAGSLLGAATGGGLARPLTSGLGGGLSGGAALGASRGCLLAGFGGGPLDLPKRLIE